MALAMGDDAGREHGPDPGQPVELRGGGSVEIDRSRRSPCGCWSWNQSRTGARDRIESRLERRRRRGWRRPGLVQAPLVEARADQQHDRHQQGAAALGGSEREQENLRGGGFETCLISISPALQFASFNVTMKRNSRPALTASESVAESSHVSSRIRSSRLRTHSAITASASVTAAEA